MILLHDYSKVQYGDIILALAINETELKCINSINISETRAMIKLYKLLNTSLYKMIKYNNESGFMWEKIR